MKGLILDASVAASWLLTDELSSYAESVLDEMQNGEPVFVPSLWPLEISNVLLTAERRKRIDKKHRNAALDRVARLAVTIIASPTMADLPEIRKLSDKYQLTAYDAEYLRVALNLSLPLATQDGNLAAAAAREKRLWMTRS